MQNINFPFTVTLAGDSIWEYEGPSTVTVTAINLYYANEDWDPVEANAEDAQLSHITVEHDTDWRIYTDSGFERAITEALGLGERVMFTEQGMQEDNLASMEI